MKDDFNFLNAAVVIGFTGKAGSGKSSVCSSIRLNPKYHKKYNILIQPFSLKLKEIARSMGWNGEKDDKGRRLLQSLGTDCGRECIGTDIWTKFWMNDVEDWCHHMWINDYYDNPFMILVDDVRFDDEVECIRKFDNSLIINLTDRSYYKSGDKVLEHASESGISSELIDFNVSSDCNLDQLISSCDIIISNFLDKVR